MSYDVNYLKALVRLNTVSGTDDPEAATATATMAERLSAFLLAQGLVVLEFECSTGQKSVLGLAPTLLPRCDQAQDDYVPPAPGTESGTARSTGRGTGLGLLLSGHYDVVPFNCADWATPPLELTARGDRLYGRGSADMKGFLSCMLQLAAHNSARARERAGDGGRKDARAGARNGAPPQLPQVSYLFTCEEETSMAGAQELAQLLSKPELTLEDCVHFTLRLPHHLPTELRPQFPSAELAALDGVAPSELEDSAPQLSALELLTCECDLSQYEACSDPAEIATLLNLIKAAGQFDLTVIGEPTQMQPILGHKGWIARDLIITGAEGHGSRSPVIYSAMQSLPIVLSELKQLQAQLTAFADERFELKPATLSLGTIHGGQSYNTVCAQITLGLEVRPTPQLTLSKLHELLEHCVAAINAQLPPQYPVRLEAPYPDTPAFPEGHESQATGAALAPRRDDSARYQDYLAVLSPKWQQRYRTTQASSYVAYCTEASWLQAITQECVIMGPGSIADAHQANEGIDQSELEECLTALKRLQARFER